eukprot:CAMPEP_0116884626 /NCGR_PEP_ID=MMETSP0463-20121206/17588_1 /TAXON_ID=181622 /ORGANISM="Strombidinopsis sp, Strain SopsisLIS2011" /LENGTH=43 /DNA_ID= /DNA_START= /DNA_END= /DNA_ORIENTATION=
MEAETVENEKDVEKNEDIGTVLSNAVSKKSLSPLNQGDDIQSA